VSHQNLGPRTRELILARTSGRSRAKAKGVRFGRPGPQDFDGTRTIRCSYPRRGAARCQGVHPIAPSCRDTVRIGDYGTPGRRFQCRRRGSRVRRLAAILARRVGRMDKPRADTPEQDARTDGSSLLRLWLFFFLCFAPVCKAIFYRRRSSTVFLLKAIHFLVGQVFDSCQSVFGSLLSQHEF